MSSFFLFGCKNNKLTREKAAEIISKNFPRKVYNQFQYGNYSSLHPFPAQYDIEYGLMENGLINIEKTGSSEGFISFDYYKISIPENLKHYEHEVYNESGNNPSKKQKCLIKIGEQSFVSITGIHEINDQEAEVEYTWTFANSTPFAKVFKSYILFNDEHRMTTTSYYYNSKKTETSKVVLKRFDDGWRLSQTFNYPSMYKSSNDPQDEYPEIQIQNSLSDTTAPISSQQNDEQNNDHTNSHPINQEPSYIDGEGRFVYRSDCYIIVYGAASTIEGAKLQIEKAKSLGYHNSGYLWIPDYPSLSAKRNYAVIIGPYNSYEQCVEQLRTMPMGQKFWYGKKISMVKQQQEEIRVLD